MAIAVDHIMTEGRKDDAMGWVFKIHDFSFIHIASVQPRWIYP